MMRRALFGLPAAFLGVTSPGDKLRRPQNAPYAQQTPIGVQPGSPSITVAHIIIVSGPGGGTFVYSGTPGPGNPPVAWISNGTTDPYGNALPDGAQMGLAGSGTFVAGNTLITPSGIFTYSPSIANGNLVASISGANGTAPTGDATLAGLVSYFESAGEIAQLISGQLRLFVGATMMTALFTADGITLNVASGNPVSVPGTLTAGSTLSVTAGKSTLTGGTAGAPTVITTDTWHSLTLLNGWANNVSFGAARYRLMENNCYRVQGVINATAATAATFGAIPASPVNAGGAPVGCNAGAGASTVPTLRWDTSGNLTINNLTIPSASAVFFTQDIPMDS